MEDHFGDYYWEFLIPIKFQYNLPFNLKSNNAQMYKLNVNDEWKWNTTPSGTHNFEKWNFTRIRFVQRISLSRVKVNFWKLRMQCYVNKIINYPIEKILEEILVLFSDEENTRKSARIFKFFEEICESKNYSSQNSSRNLKIVADFLMFSSSENNTRIFSIG